jgi:S-DNA-T family DNA segregation ATPase FtsK/SpoIIIE
MARRVREEIIGVCTVLGGVYLALCVSSYEKWDPSLFTHTTKPASNYGGVVGAYLADFCMSAIGVASFALPLFLIVYGVKTVLGRRTRVVHIAGTVLFFVSATAIATLVEDSFSVGIRAGGIAGHYGRELLVRGLSVPGAYIVALALFFSSLVLLSPVSLVSLVLRLRERTGKPEVPAEKEGDVSDVFPGADHLEELGHDIGETDMPISVEPPLEVVTPRGVPGASRREKGKRDDAYQLPGLELLGEYGTVEGQSRAELSAGSSLLEQKLLDFNVEGRVTQVNTGPIVTMFEFEPAPGVKINRVVSLAEDLALALKAPSIRISAVPGRAAIGIEIPNRKRETVSLREIIGSDKFRRSPSTLTLALGKDIFGSPVVADLSRMPHLLVAGATGSGKSVALNSMVMSLLYKARPSELKLLMIDPKLLELSAYEGIPHLISPVVTNPREAADMLRKMVFEMERRYRLIAERGVRNIESFNAAAEGEEERLPYVVIFIDEFADLMFASASQVEDSIARLAQMARASGMHLVLATQRPSVDVITGVIKANFPARVAFQVTSRIDSRTIIDTQGAEQLLGRGDMLLMLPGVKTVRVHGAYVSEAEVRDVVEHSRSQGRPDYSIVENIAEVEAEAQAEAEYSEDRDELYWKAVDLAEALGEVSISSVQRRLKIGYNRAARIMELLEEDGMVGPPRGAGKPRDFLGRRNP